MKTTTTQRAAVTMTAAGLLLALSGCVPAQPVPTASARPTASTHSAPATDAAQSHAAACTIVNDGLKKVTALQAEASSVASDPAKASALLDKLNAQVQSIDDA